MLQAMRIWSCLDGACMRMRVGNDHFRLGHRMCCAHVFVCAMLQAMRMTPGGNGICACLDGACVRMRVGNDHFRLGHRMCCDNDAFSLRHRILNGALDLRIRRLHRKESRRLARNKDWRQEACAVED